jgi:hypothetical protein
VHDTRTVIVLSVVALVLVLGVGACIIINPLATIGLLRYSQPLPRSSTPSADTPPSATPAGGGLRATVADGAIARVVSDGPDVPRHRGPTGRHRAGGRGRVGPALRLWPVTRIGAGS